MVTKNGLFDVLNSSVCLRYRLLPYFYTQLYKAATYGTPVLRPLAFEYLIKEKIKKLKKLINIYKDFRPMFVRLV